MCPSAPRVCSEPGGQKPVLSLSLDLIELDVSNKHDFTSLGRNSYITTAPCINTLRLRQNGQHFADDILKRIYFNENVWILIKISLKFVPRRLISSIPALVQIIAWRRPGDKPLSDPMMVWLPTHICVTQPQWVKTCCSLVIRGHVCISVHAMIRYILELRVVAMTAAFVCFEASPIVIMAVRKTSSRRPSKKLSWR